MTETNIPPWGFNTTDSGFVQALDQHVASASRQETVTQTTRASPSKYLIARTPGIAGHLAGEDITAQTSGCRK